MDVVDKHYLNFLLIKQFFNLVFSCHQKHKGRLLFTFEQDNWNY